MDYWKKRIYKFRSKPSLKTSCDLYIKKHIFVKWIASSHGSESIKYFIQNTDYKLSNNFIT